jgi:hypothetical protein
MMEMVLIIMRSPEIRRLRRRENHIRKVTPPQTHPAFPPSRE